MRGATYAGTGVTVTVSTRTTVLFTRTVSYRVTYTVSVRVGCTSPFDTLIRVSDVVLRRSFAVSCCAANELAIESAAARPSAQVVMERTRITEFPPGALHAAT